MTADVKELHATSKECYLFDFDNIKSRKEILDIFYGEKGMKAPYHSSQPAFSFIKTRFYEFDTETAYTDETKKERRVFLLCGVTRNDNGELEYVELYDIEDFIPFLENISSEYNLGYFHNLTYDWSYIGSYLLRKGWTDTEYGGPYTYHKIDNNGSIISVTLNLPNGKLFQLRCSYKKTGKSVKDLATDDDKKLIELAEKNNIYGDKIAPKGYVPNEEEIKYCCTDCRIPFLTVEQMIRDGKDAYTVSGDARKVMKNELDKMAFELKCEQRGYNIDYNEACILRRQKKKLPFVWGWRDIWPVFSKGKQELLQYCYNGGLVIKNDAYVRRDIQVKGVDVTSMYPTFMAKELPYGKVTIKERPSEGELYCVIFRSRFCPKKGKEGVPASVKIKSQKGFNSDWYKSSYDESTGKLEKVWLGMYCTEFERFKEDYDCDISETVYLCFEYKGVYLKNLVDEFFALKTQLKREKKELKELKQPTGDIERRYMAIKAIINSLYGSTAKSEIYREVHEELKDGVLCDVCDGFYVGEQMYMPVAVAVTANARNMILEPWRLFPQYCVYTDTDSVKVIWNEITEAYFRDKIDPTEEKLGMFTLDYRGETVTIYVYNYKNYIVIEDNEMTDLEKITKIREIYEKEQSDSQYDDDLDKYGIESVGAGLSPRDRVEEVLMYYTNGRYLPDTFTVHHSKSVVKGKGGRMFVTKEKTISLENNGGLYLRFT